MFCGECGTQNPDTNQFCKNCGKPLKKTQVTAVQPPAAAFSPPVTATTPGTAAQPGLTDLLKKRKFAIASIVCGLASFVVVPYILAILAIILGAIAVWKKDYLGIIGIIAAIITVIIDMCYFLIF